MSYTLPYVLHERIRKDSLRSTSIQKMTVPLESINSMRAFSFLVSEQVGVPYEEVSRQEITFYDKYGDEVGSCLQQGHFMSAWCNDSSYVDGGETVEEALARFDDDTISFIFVAFYNHSKIKSIRVYNVA